MTIAPMAKQTSIRLDQWCVIVYRLSLGAHLHPSQAKKGTLTGPATEELSLCRTRPFCAQTSTNRAAQMMFASAVSYVGAKTCRILRQISVAMQSHLLHAPNVRHLAAGITRKDSRLVVKFAVLADRVILVAYVVSS